MSLASPLSIGDAILLASIAYDIGKAFSSGAKSAPAEFAEVQSLLFSIGDALDLVGKTCKGRTGQDVPEEAAVKFDGILLNCQTVLKSLEGFVDRYSVLDSSQASNPGAQGARVWKRDILKNFKKVKWTTEGEGIMKLKQTLTAHVQVLNLAVNTINGQKQAFTQEDVSETREHVQSMRTKLDEIHTWYEENLKRSPQSPSSPRRRSGPTDEAGSFALYEEQGNSIETQAIVCPNARLEDLWTDEFKAQAAVPGPSIFRCGCSSRAHSHIMKYTLLPFSLIVQVIGKYCGMQWQVYVRSPASNTPVSLVFRDIDSRDISRMETWIEQASLYSAPNHMSNGLQTSFVKSDGDAVSVLWMKMNPMKYIGKLLNVVFRTSNGAFAVGRFSSTQVLQYATTSHPQRLMKPMPAQLLPQTHVNIVLQCAPVAGQAQKCFTIRVNKDTNVSLNEKPRYVTIENAICFQETVKLNPQGSTSTGSLECSKITLEFSDSADAHDFLADLQDAKQKLCIQYLRQVRWGDRLIGQMDIPGEIIIRNFILQDLQLKVILDQATELLRLAFVRRDHSACVTFELPPSFFDDLTAGKESGYKNHPAWFMDIGKDRITITKQESGMDPLVLLSKAFQDSNMRNDPIEIEDVDGN